MGFVKVCSASEISSGEMKVFNLHNIEFLIYQADGKFYALYNKCPHMGGSLGDGVVAEGYVTCPLHGWQFDPKTGKGPAGYEDSIPTFDIKVEGTDVLINEDQLIALSKNKDYLVKCAHDSKERFKRTHDSVEPELDSVMIKSVWKSSQVLPMRTLKKVPQFDDILFRAAQLHHIPRNKDEPINLKTVIGKKSKHPVEISMPVYVSHMSFGALSKEAKLALAKGTAQVGTIMCSGEGGSHPDESAAAKKYIYEIGTACFTRKEEWIKRADAIEIKIGQAAKPGLGGHLPQSKITDEIADLRGIPKDEDQISPGRFPDINNKDDLKTFVAKLKEQTGGKPIGIKFAAGHVEKDLEVALFAEPDFITIDGRGGGTGAAPIVIKDNFAMPTVYALARARKYLDEHAPDVTLVITGGFRTTGDIAKALAMGADAVAVATTAMMAIGCQQYRACHTGNCPVGIATQKQNLRDRFSVEESTERLVNFFGVMKHELEEIAQAIGIDAIHKLSYDDLLTTDLEISSATPIEHA